MAETITIGGIEMGKGENFKGMLLYNGSRDNNGEVIYPEFSKDDIRKLLDAGVNELIILDGGLLYNYYIDDKGEYHQIVTLEDVDKLPPEITEISRTPGWHEKFQEGYRNRIKDTGKGRNLNDHVRREVELAKRLVEVDKDIHIWLSFPGVILHGMADMFYNAYKEYVFELSKKSLPAEIWEHNIRGFYFSTEDIVNDFTVFYHERNEYNSDFNNPIVKLIKGLSELVHADNKKMLWIPYYRLDRWAETGKRMGYIANRTDFFDYIVIQPSYFFSKNTKANINVIEESVKRQEVVDFYGDPFGGEKISKTIIGAEMEIAEDSSCSVSTRKDEEERYLAYVNAFKQFSGKYPIIYYASYRDSVMSPKIYNYIKDMFGE